MTRISRSASVSCARTWCTRRASSRRPRRWLGVEPRDKNRWANSRDDRSGSGTSRPTARCGGLDVLPACHEQPLVGRLAQPDVKRHRLARQEVGQPAERLQLSLLHDVRWIDPAAHLRVHAELDELAQFRPVPRQEPVERPAIARPGLAEQALRLGGVG